MDSSNKDEANRCLLIAKNHYGVGNYSSAVKLAKKSISLNPTEDAKAFLIKAEKSLAEYPNGKMASSSKSTDNEKQQQQEETTTKEKKHTPEQINAVKAILECGTDYYKVLNLNKKCTEVELKKSYRKLALQFHPDKNSAPGADEAFKLISKAFTVLSDPQKRAIHDAGGGDPEQRGNAGGGFSGFRTYNQQAFGEEISPEDLFNMFFGGNGNMMGGGFNPGFQFSSATFVGPGFRTHTFNPGRGFSQQHQQHQQHQQRQRQQQQQTQGSSGWAIFLQLLPLLVLFGYSIFSGLMPDNSPTFSFQPTSVYTQSRTTQSHNIPYFVNPSTFRATEQNSNELSRIEQKVLMNWVRELQQSCQLERNKRSEKIKAASGILGIGRDEKRYQEALNWPTKSCDEVAKIGYNKDF